MKILFLILLLLSYQVSAEEVVGLVERLAIAKKELNEKKYDHALTLLLSIKSEEPNNKEINYWLSRAYEAKGDFEQAIILLEKTAGQFDDLVQLKLDMARLKIKSGDPDSAINILQAMLSVPDNQAIRKQIRKYISDANISKFQKNNDDYAVISIILKMTLLFPDNVKYYQMLGQSYASLDMIEDAILSYNFALNNAVYDENYSTIVQSLVELYKQLNDTHSLNALVIESAEISELPALSKLMLDELFLLANRDVNTGTKDRAMASLQTIIRIQPSNSRATYLLSELYVENNQLPSAIDLLDNYISRNPQDSNAKRLIANFYAKADDLEQQIDQYESIVENSSNQTQLSIDRSRLSALRQQYVLKNVNFINKTQNEKLEIAEYWLQQSDLQATMALLQKMLAKDSQNALANYLMGNILSKRKKVLLAKKYLTQAIYYAPKNIEYQNFYANLLYISNEYKPARLIYNNMLGFVEDSDEIKKIEFAIAEIDVKLDLSTGNIISAIERYKLLYQRFPDKSQYLLNKLISLFVQAGDGLQAQKLRMLLAQKQRASQTFEFQVKQASALTKQNRFSEAFPLLVNLYNENSENSKVLYWLGYIYAQKKQYKDAIKYVQNSVRYSPENIKLKFYLGRLLAISGRLNEAKLLYRKMLKTNNNPKIRLQLAKLLGFVSGQLLIDNKQYPAALVHFQKMRELYGEDLGVLDALASLFSKTDESLKLQTVFVDILKLAPRRLSTLNKLASLYLTSDQEAAAVLLLQDIIRYDENGQEKSKAIQILLNTGKKHLLDKKYQAAENIFRSITQIQPKNIAANLAIAETYQLQNRNKQAERAFQEILSIQPFNFHVRSLLASFYAKRSKLDTAIAEYQTINRLDKNGHFGREAKANINLLQGFKSNRLINQIATDKNLDIDAIIKTARDWINQRRLDPAFNVLQAMLKKYSDNSQVQYWLGSVYDRKRNFKLAIKHVKKSVELSENNPKLYTAFGRILSRAGKYDEAEAAYRKSIELDENIEFTKETTKLLGFLLAQRLISESRFEDALEQYQDMLEINPDDMTILARIASVHLALNNLKTAEAIFKQVVLTNPDSPSVHLQLADVYQLQKNDIAYKNELQQVILLDPDGLGLQAANQLGLGDGNRLLTEKKWTKAIEAFARVLETDSGNIYARVGISKANIGAGKIASAEQLLVSLLESDPSSANARLALAQVYVKTGRLSAAVVELERIIFVSSGSRYGEEAKINLTNIYRSKAKLLSEKGDIAGAVKEYLKAVSRDNDDVDAHLALAEIYQKEVDYYQYSIEHYRHALRIDNSNYRVAMNLGVLYEKTRKYEAAMMTFTNALANYDKGDQNLINRLVNAIRIQVLRMVLKDNVYPWIIVELQEMLQLEPNSPRLNIFLSDVYRVMEEYQLSIEALQSALLVVPKHSIARYRLAVLYERVSELKLALAQYRSIVRLNVNPRVVAKARDKIPNLEDRVKIINYTLSYSVVESRTRFRNVNFNSYSFNSVINLDLNARFRPQKNWNLVFNLSPTYTAQHVTQSDSISPKISFSSDVSQERSSLVFNINRFETKSLLLDVPQGSEINASITATQKLKLPIFLLPDDRVLPDTFQFQFSARHFKSTDLSRSSVFSLKPGVNFITPIPTGGAVVVSYSFKNTVNLEAFGTDYANLAHRGTFLVRKLLHSGFSGLVAFSLEYQRFSNFDAFRTAVVRRPPYKRRIVQASFSSRLEYRFNRRLSMFANLTLLENRSNLPRYAFIYNADIASSSINQSSILDDFRVVSVASGVRFRF